MSIPAGLPHPTRKEIYYTHSSSVTPVSTIGIAQLYDASVLPMNPMLTAPCYRYPKQQRLLALKKASVAQHALAPRYLPFSSLSSLHPSKFDVILIDPPFSSSFTWEDLQDLPIPALAADPSFVLMWVGSGAGEGLERGREIMAKWGFRRCEDIVWVKTNNTTNQGPGVCVPSVKCLTANVALSVDRSTYYVAFD